MNKFLNLSLSVILIVSTIIMPSCKKDDLPTLTTVSVSEITYTQAKSGGQSVDDGGAAIISRGICWSTSEKPTLADHSTSDGKGTGNFVSQIEGLTAGTTYYVRAYATNSEGTGYGNQLSFSTPAYEVAGITTSPISEASYTSAKSGGNISNDGGSPITAKGVCWNTTENPTIAGSKTTDGSGTGAFVSSITGLTAGTTYYVRAYATNSVGTSYGSQVSFSTSAILVPSLTTAAITNITATSAATGGNITSDGGSEVTARGVCWGTSANPTIAGSKTSNGTGTGAFISNLTGLTEGITYYVRAYATNSAGTAYGNQESFTTTLIVVPSLTTANITGLTPINAVSGGNITNNGGSVITAKGICWSTSQNPTVDDNLTSEASGSDTYSSNLTGLTNGTVYYVRAYATNVKGTSYGNQISFITPVADIDGNQYSTVKIGNQVWMTENLKVTKMKNNTDIPNVTDNTEWTLLSTPAYSWLDNNETYKNTYGAIYNWFAVETGNVCPTGWHVPTDQEFNTLEISLGLSPADANVWGYRGTDQATQMKSTTTWEAGANGTNSSGFNVKAGGYRQWTGGTFPGQGVNAYLWTSSDDAGNGNPTVGWYRRFDADARVYKGATEKEGGKSVRCLKD